MIVALLFTDVHVSKIGRPWSQSMTPLQVDNQSRNGRYRRQDLTHRGHRQCNLQPPAVDDHSKHIRRNFGYLYCKKYQLHYHSENIVHKARIKARFEDY